MSNFVITQEDWEAERDRLIANIKSTSCTPEELSELTHEDGSPMVVVGGRTVNGFPEAKWRFLQGVMQPLESFCRVYCCAVSLTMRRKHAVTRRSIGADGHAFLAETSLQAEAALIDAGLAESEEESGILTRQIDVVVEAMAPYKLTLANTRTASYNNLKLISKVVDCTNEKVETVGGVRVKTCDDRLAPLTGEQVCNAMIKANIRTVNHHRCGACDAMVRYFREEDRLYFDPSCNCASGTPEPRFWDEAAEWINMQTKVEVRNDLRARFGLPPEYEPE